MASKKKISNARNSDMPKVNHKVFPLSEGNGLDRERETDVRETDQLVSSCMCSDQGQGSSLQPRYMPLIGVKPGHFHLQAATLSTEPHCLGLNIIFKSKNLNLYFKILKNTF